MSVNYSVVEDVTKYFWMIFDSEIKFISVRKWLWLTKKGNITIQRWFVPSFTWFTSDIEVLVLMLIYLKLVKTMVGCFLTEVSEKILIKWEGIFSKEIVVLNKSVCWVCIVAISPITKYWFDKLQTMGNRW